MALSDEEKAKLVAWYLEEDERTLLDAAFEFSTHPSTAQQIVKEAGVSKSPHRNKNKNSPVNDGRTKPSDKKSIRSVQVKHRFQGHRRRGSY